MRSSEKDKGIMERRKEGRKERRKEGIKDTIWFRVFDGLVVSGSFRALRVCVLEEKEEEGEGAVPVIGGGGGGGGNGVGVVVK